MVGLSKLWVTFFLEKKNLFFLIVFFFSKGCKPYNFEKNATLFCRRSYKVYLYIYISLTITQNKSSNQIIKIKHYLILCPDNTYYNPVTKLIKIKHYLALCPDHTRYIFPHIPQTTSVKALNWQIIHKNSEKCNEVFSHKLQKNLYLLPFWHILSLPQFMKSEKILQYQHSNW